MSNKNYIKGALAKLLAEENMLIRYQPVGAASFDYQRRVLTLPNLKDDIDEVTYNMIIGREAGRALYSQNLVPSSSVYHQISPNNVPWGRKLYEITDGIRTERLIKQKYPGLARDFNDAYTKIFGALTKHTQDPFNPKTCSLVDRISAYFRIGSSENISFDANEQKIVEQFEKMVTQADAIEVAKKLREFIDEPPSSSDSESDDDDQDNSSDGENQEKDSSDKKSKNNKKNPDKKNSKNGDSKNESDEEEKKDKGDSKKNDSKNSGDEKDSDSNGNDESSNDSSDDEDEQDNSSDGENNSPSQSENDKPQKQSNSSNPPKTPGGIGKETNNPQIANASLSDALDKSMSGKIDTTGISYDLVLFPEYLDPDEFIVDYKTLHTDMISSYGKIDISMKSNKSADLKKWIDLNNPTITAMVTEFERRKRAALYRRQKTAKTGLVDTNRLSHAMYSEDIFRRVTTLPEGKNHGFVMIIDWSGSMQSNMADTLDQLMNQVAFCRRRKIPYEVYAFSDACSLKVKPKFKVVKKKNYPDSIWPSSMKLLEFFNDQMSNSEHIQAMENINQVRISYENLYGIQKKSEIKHNAIALGGTPLNSAIIITPFLIERMRERTKAEILKVIILTDGASNGDLVKVDNTRNYSGTSSALALSDRKTGFSRSTANGIEFTGSLIEAASIRAKCDYVGVYLVDKGCAMNKLHFESLVNGFTLTHDDKINRKSNNLDLQFAKMQKDGFVVADSFGFSEYYLLTPSQKEQTVKKQQTLESVVASKKVNRSLLSRFIEKLAV